jgi:hypothetical protein
VEALEEVEEEVLVEGLHVVQEENAYVQTVDTGNLIS